MKVLCKRDELAHAFGLAASVATDRSKPILGNVKLEATKGGAALLAGNLAVWIHTKLPAGDVTVTTPGEVLLPVNRVAAYLRTAAGDQVAISSDASSVLLKSDRGTARFSTEPPAEFPALDLSRGKAVCGLLAQFLREAIHRTGFAVTTESMWAVSGLRLEIAGQLVDVVGTDTHRIAWQYGTVAEAMNLPDSPCTATIAGEALQALARILRGDKDGIVRIAMDDSVTVLSSGQTTLLAQSVTGRFPKWRKHLPLAATKRESCLDLMAGVFCAAVQQAVTARVRDSREIVIVRRAGTLTMGTKTEAGESRAELPIAYEGPECAVVLNSDFLIEYLNVLSPDAMVEFEMGDGTEAVVCRTSDGYVYAVQPFDKSRCRSQLEAAGVAT